MPTSESKLVKVTYDGSNNIYRVKGTNEPYIELDEFGNPISSQGQFLSEHPWMNPSGQNEDPDPSNGPSTAGFRSPSVFQNVMKIFKTK